MVTGTRPPVQHTLIQGTSTCYPVLLSGRRMKLSQLGGRGLSPQKRVSVLLSVCMSVVGSAHLRRQEETSVSRRSFAKCVPERRHHRHRLVGVHTLKIVRSEKCRKKPGRHLILPHCPAASPTDTSQLRQGRLCLLRVTTPSIPSEMHPLGPHSPPP